VVGPNPLKHEQRIDLGRQVNAKQLYYLPEVYTYAMGLGGCKARHLPV
jgi:hypothetical protein